MQVYKIDFKKIPITHFGTHLFNFDPINLTIYGHARPQLKSINPYNSLSTYDHCMYAYLNVRNICDPLGDLAKSPLFNFHFSLFMDQ